jgi:hypothetical protein
MKTGTGARSALGKGPRSRRFTRYRLATVVAFLGAANFTTVEPAFAIPADPNLTMRIRVDNYTQASASTVDRAEREAGRILGTAGLQVAWLNCLERIVNGIAEDPCRQPLEATDLMLRIRATPAQNMFHETIFGFAVHPILATIYYDYALRRVQEEGAEFEVSTLMGGLIAHEIGHLLLGPNSHAKSGMMQSRWERKQVRQAMTGALSFTPQQSKTIVTRWRDRMGVEMAKY